MDSSYGWLLRLNVQQMVDKGFIGGGSLWWLTRDSGSWLELPPMSVWQQTTMESRMEARSKL
jgi:hypothetical protein